MGFGTKFGDGGAYWNTNELSRDVRMNKSREFGSLWHQEIFSGAHQEDDPVKDGELFDFDGRVSSSEGRFPSIVNVLSFTEDDIILSAKTGFRRAIGVFNRTFNNIRHSDDLTEWGFDNALVYNTSYYYNGIPFNKIVGRGLNTYSEVYTTAQSISTSDKPYIYFVLKKGTSLNSRVQLTDGTTDFIIADIAWQTNSVSVTGDDVNYVNWDEDNEIVIVGAVSSSTPTTNALTVRLYAEYNSSTTVDSSNYMYATAFMVTSSNGAVPYVLGARDYGQLAYDYTWNDVGTMEFWVHPMNVMSTSMTKNYISNTYYHPETSILSRTFFFYYVSTSNYFRLYIEGNSNFVTITSTAFSSNVDLLKWHHIKLCWDTINNYYAFYLDGELVGEDTTDIGGWDPPGVLNILSEPYSSNPYINIADAMICDLLIKPYIDKTDSHYRKNRPYYVPKEITSDNTKFIISPYGISIKNGGIDIKDSDKRNISIGGGQGLRADSPYGHIIHDIPDGWGDNLSYGGHIYYNNSYETVFTYNDYDTTTNTTATHQSAIQTIDISDALPGQIENVSGIIITLKVRLEIDGVKTGMGTTGEGYVATNIPQFNTVPGAPVDIWGVKLYHTASDADNIPLYYETRTPAFIPVWKDETGKYYILIRTTYNFDSMTSSSGTYGIWTAGYLQGITI